MRRLRCSGLLLLRLLTLIQAVDKDATAAMTRSLFNMRGGDVPVSKRRRARLGLALRSPIVAVRGVLGRTRGLLRSRRQMSKRPEEAVIIDHTFDDLDSILEATNNPSAAVVDEWEAADDGVLEDGADWVNSLMQSLPETANRLKGWRQRSYRDWVNRIEKKFVSSETSRALRTVKSILDNFAEYGVIDLLSLYSPRDVIASIIALSRLQAVLSDDDIKRKRFGKKKEAEVDEALLDELAHYSHFASVAYGWKGGLFCGGLQFGRNNRVLSRRTGVKMEDIVQANWHSRANRPAYYIVRDHDRNSIVLGIRGTLSPRDVLTDLCASTGSFIIEDGYAETNRTTDNLTEAASSCPLRIECAHKGMIDGAKGVARTTGQIITAELDANPDYSLVIVGHSLGGGVAAVLAAMWSDRFLNRVRSFGFGNPCVFPRNSTASYTNIVSVIGQGDPFATLSLGHIVDTTRALSTLCKEEAFREEILKRLGQAKTAQDLSKDDLKWLQNAKTYLKQQMDAEKLYPPGQLVYMSGTLFNLDPVEGVSVGQKGDLRPMHVDRFGELMVHVRMFDVSQHLPVRYEAVLKRLNSSNSNR